MCSRLFGGERCRSEAVAASNHSLLSAVQKELAAPKLERVADMRACLTQPMLDPGEAQARRQRMSDHGRKKRVLQTQEAWM
jgi:hypothetical protein